MLGAALIFVGGSISLPALIYLLVGFAEPVFVLAFDSIIIYSIFKNDLSAVPKFCKIVDYATPEQHRQ